MILNKIFRQRLRGFRFNCCVEREFRKSEVPKSAAGKQSTKKLDLSYDLHASKASYACLNFRAKNAKISPADVCHNWCLARKFKLKIVGRLKLRSLTNSQMLKNETFWVIFKHCVFHSGLTFLTFALSIRPVGMLVLIDDRR